MPAKIVSFFHHSVVSGAIALGTAFDVNKKHTHDLRAGATPGVAGQRFRERVEGIHIRLSAVGSATKVTVKVTLDALGDDIVLPDTEVMMYVLLQAGVQRQIIDSTNMAIRVSPSEYLQIKRQGLSSPIMFGLGLSTDLSLRSPEDLSIRALRTTEKAARESGPRKQSR